MDYKGTGTGKICDPSWFNPGGEDDFEKPDRFEGTNFILESESTFGLVPNDATNYFPNPKYPTFNPLEPNLPYGMQVDNLHAALYVSIAVGEVAGGMLLDWLIEAVSARIASYVARNGGKTLFNFGKSAGEHMLNPAREVPIQIIDDVIKSTKGLPDPAGSEALMHYSTMFKNGKMYNLEVLYDQASNSIWHFKYSTEALGPLPAIR